MAKKTDPNQIGESPSELRQALIDLRNDFDSHNHDGTSSRRFQTLTLDSQVIKGVYANGIRIISSTSPEGIRDLSFYSQNNKALLATISALADGSLSFAPTGSVSSFFSDIEVSGDAIYPSNDGGSDLGRTGQSWNDLYLLGTIWGDFSIDGDVSMGGDLHFGVGKSAYDNAGGTLINIFGTGADGSVTVSTNQSLARDIYCQDLTVTSNSTLDTAGYKIYVAGTLTVNSGSKISRIGNNGSNGGAATGSGGGNGGTGGSGGAALPAGTLFGSVAGPNGGTATNGQAGTGGSGISGATPADANPSLSPFNGVSMAFKHGGAGGAGTNSAGATTQGSVGGVVTVVKNIPTTVWGAIMLGDYLSTYIQHVGPAASGSATSGSGGGGSGGGASGAGGGGGGAGGNGGIVAIYAQHVILNGVGTVSVKGGTGGNGGTGGSPDFGSGLNRGAGGGGCGGAGGGGGIIIIVYKTIVEAFGGDVCFDVSGGVAGTGGVGGTSNGTGAQGSNGNDGNDGQVGVLWRVPV